MVSLQLPGTETLYPCIIVSPVFLIFGQNETRRCKLKNSFKSTAFRVPCMIMARFDNLHSINVQGYRYQGLIRDLYTRLQVRKGSGFDDEKN